MKALAVGGVTVENSMVSKPIAEKTALRFLRAAVLSANDGVLRSGSGGALRLRRRLYATTHQQPKVIGFVVGY